MNPKELIQQYLKQVNIMQLATSQNDQTWACNIHFYADDKLNLYWISTEERLHSQQIKYNHNVAAAILVHENTAEEDYVIGLSLAGQAEYVGENISDEIGRGFSEKHAKDPNLLAEISSGQNPNKFYKLTPTKIVLFDTKNFPDNPRQELEL